MNKRIHAPSFVHVRGLENEHELPLPETWFNVFYKDTLPVHNIWIHTLHGYCSEVRLRLDRPTLFLSAGWKKINDDLNIKFNNIVCLTIIDRGNFELVFYGKNKIPKNWFNCSKNWNQVRELQQMVFQMAHYRRFPSIMAAISEHNEYQLPLCKKSLWAYKAREAPENHVIIHYNGCYKKRIGISKHESRMTLTTGWPKLKSDLNIIAGYKVIFYAIDNLNLELIIYNEVGCDIPAGPYDISAEMEIPNNYVKPSEYWFLNIEIPRGKLLRLPEEMMLLPGLRSGKRVFAYNMANEKYKWKLKQEKSKKKPNLCVSYGFKEFRKANKLRPKMQCGFRYRFSTRSFHLFHVTK